MTVKKWGTALLLMACVAPAQVSAAAAAASAKVDLTLSYDAPAIAPGGRGTQTFTVGNAGEDATGPVALTVTTPAFTGVARGEPLPAGCVFLYSSPDPGVPEVLGCTLGPVRHGQTMAVRVPLAVDPSAPAGSLWGEAAVLPAPGSADTEGNPADNLGPASIVVTSPSVTPPPGRNVTDLYVTTTIPALAPERPGTELFTIGNLGPQPTTGPVRLIVATPPFVKVDRTQQLPAGCGYLYDNAEPSVPQILRCVLAGELTPRAERPVALPLAVEQGAPHQTLWGVTDVLPDATEGSADTDPTLANNLIESAAQIVG